MINTNLLIQNKENLLKEMKLNLKQKNDKINSLMSSKPVSHKKSVASTKPTNQNQNQNIITVKKIRDTEPSNNKMNISSEFREPRTNRKTESVSRPENPLNYKDSFKKLDNEHLISMLEKEANSRSRGVRYLIK